MIKKFLLAIFCLVLLLVLIYAALIYENNRDTAPVSQQGLKASLENATQWAVNNREAILEQNSAMLWWWIKRSAEISNDYRLLKLYKDYHQRYIDSNYASVWRPLFTQSVAPTNLPERLMKFPDYNIYFIYGFTCDQTLAELPIVRAQMGDNFCADEHPVSPACVTHQLMGLRFRQQSQCGDRDAMAQQVSVLQSKIERQLTRDPRVVDVYIQRVLMLADTGAAEKLSPVWVSRVLEYQNVDGGWGGFQPVIGLAGGKSLGFSARSLTVSEPKSTFHATAQGILLMTLLLNELEASSD